MKHCNLFFLLSYFFILQFGFLSMCVYACKKSCSLVLNRPNDFKMVQFPPLWRKYSKSVFFQVGTLFEQCVPFIMLTHNYTQYKEKYKWAIQYTTLKQKYKQDPFIVDWCDVINVVEDKMLSIIAKQRDKPVDYVGTTMISFEMLLGILHNNFRIDLLFFLIDYFNIEYLKVAKKCCRFYLKEKIRK